MSANDETGSVIDNTLLIATDDGKIYRLVEERWRQSDYELQGDAADFIKKDLLDNGVIVAKIPLNPVEPFFTCYLINLSMIKQAPTQTARPTGDEANAEKTRPREGKQRSGRRRHGP
jgi:hypothetical protein